MAFATFPLVSNASRFGLKSSANESASRTTEDDGVRGRRSDGASPLSPPGRGLGRRTVYNG